MGELSPVGSRVVVRQTQQALARHYRLNVAYVSGGLETENHKDLNLVATQTLAQHLKQYYVHVNVASGQQSLQAALKQAAQQGDQLLFFPRIERWPNIKPIRVHQCEDERGGITPSLKECDHDDSQKTSDDLVLTIAIFDVVGQMQVDSITARSSLGVKSYLYEDSLNELDVLNEMVIQRLAP